MGRIPQVHEEFVLVGGWRHAGIDIGRQGQTVSGRQHEADLFRRTIAHNQLGTVVGTQFRSDEARIRVLSLRLIVAIGPDTPLRRFRERRALRKLKEIVRTERVRAGGNCEAGIIGWTVHCVLCHEPAMMGLVPLHNELDPGGTVCTGSAQTGPDCVSQNWTCLNLARALVEHCKNRVGPLHDLGVTSRQASIGRCARRREIRKAVAQTEEVQTDGKIRRRRGRTLFNRICYRCDGISGNTAGGKSLSRTIGKRRRHFR